MKKFEENRIKEFNLETKSFKHPIPTIYINPINITDKSVVFIYNTGLGSSNAIIKYMNFDIFNDHWLVSYEKTGHGANQNKPTQWKTTYQKELDEIVDWVKKEFPNRKIYLLGESWGSQINMLYYGKHLDKVNGTVNWNAPFNIQNPEKQPAKIIFLMAIKHLATLLFNKTCTLPKVQNSQEKFSRNFVLNRALNIVPPVKNNSKATINVWKYMMASYRWIKKHGKDPKYNFLYVQSGEDVLADPKLIKKLEKYVDNQHLLLIPTGYHVLSFEPVESKILYETILSFISK